MRRPNSDTRQVPTSPAPNDQMDSMQVWAIPDASDKTWQRQIKVLNDIDGQGEEGVDLKRYVCATDLSEGDNHGLWQNVSPEGQVKYDKILERLIPVHKGSVQFTRDTKHKIVLMQGPLGSGKTFTSVAMMEMCTETGVKYSEFSGSNAGADCSAEVANENMPKAGVLRYHAYDNEAKAMTRVETDPVEPLVASNAGATNSAKAPENPQRESSATATEKAKAKETMESKASAEQIKAIEDQQAWFKFMADVVDNDNEWVGEKKRRPNFNTMGLNVRALQNASVIEHDISRYKVNPEHDIHLDSRENLRVKIFAKDKSDDEKKAYKESADFAFDDALRKCPGIVSTLFKAADT